MLNAVKIGSEFLINTTTAQDQNDPAIARLASGGFVVTWADWSQTAPDTSQGAIRAQLFDAAGQKSGNEFIVNTATTDAQRAPAVASLADGRFVIGWEDASRTPGDSSGEAVRAQVFNPDGSRSGGEFVVPVALFNYQDQPAVTGLPDGRFVFAWKDISGDGGDNQVSAVKAQIFAADGARSGAEFLVNTTIANGQERPAITALPDGHFVVTWVDFSGTGNDQSNGAIRGQIFDVAGGRLGAEFLVNTKTAGLQIEPSITALPDGRFVVAWTDSSQSPDDPSGFAVRAQIFRPDGTTFGGEFLVNSATVANQSQPSMTTLPGGRFVIAWTDTGGTTATSYRIHAQVFNDDGSKLGSEFVVNTTDTAAQWRPSLAALPDGRFAVTWEDQSESSGDTSHNAIRAQIFDLRDGPEITSNGGGATATVSASENASAVTTVTATDNDSPVLSYSIVGGADAAKFQIDTATGALAFVAAPDFEAPADSGTNNSYVVTVRVSDGTQLDDQTITVNVADANDAPVITSLGGGATASVLVGESATAAVQVTATDPDAGNTVHYAIAGGADAALFEIDDVTGQLSFTLMPDFELPGDANHDNSYEVVVRASDGSLFDQQSLSVKIADFGEQVLPVTPFGSEFLVNTTTEGNQNHSTIAAFSNGRFVAAWVKFTGSVANAAQDGIRLQRFNADGTKLGNELSIDNAAGRYQADPAVTCLSDGRFVVTWSDQSLAGGEIDARAQIFNADGTRSGADFLLGASAQDQSHPAIKGLPHGGFVAAWQSAEGDIRAQVFNGDGTRIGGEFKANTTTGNALLDPAITVLAEGGFVVAWNRFIGDDATVRAQVFNPDGSRLGSELVLQSGAYTPTITSLADGRFVVAWNELSEAGPDTFGGAIRAQIFNADGTRSGVEFAVNTTTESDQFAPSIATLRDGRFVVTWADASAIGDDTSLTAIRAQVFNPDGTKSSAEFLVNTTTALDQLRPTITALADGRFVVAWEDSSGSEDDQDGTAVRGQIFDPRDAAVQLTGTAQGDDFIGTSFDDTMEGAAGDDHFDGAAGEDTAIFAQNRDQYTVQALGADRIMVSGPDGADVLASFEHFQFADVTLDAGNLHIPRITSNGGAEAATVTVSENQTVVTTVGASDGDSDAVLGYTIVGGADAALFDLDESTGALSFAAAPDFETPADADHDNVYQVVVRASDGVLFDDQVIAVGVTDVSDQGTPVAKFGNEFLINTTTLGQQTEPAIAAFNSGQFVATWIDRDGGNGETTVRAQRFNADGTKWGNELLVSATPAIFHQQPAVTTLSDGRFVVAWKDYGSEFEADVRAQMFNFDGSRSGPELVVDPARSGFEHEPAITRLADDRFIVTWREGEAELRAQVFNSDGTRSGADFQINSATGGIRLQSAITALANGGFVATWTEGGSGAGDGSLDGIRAQMFNADGSRVSAGFLVNTTTASSQQLPAVAALADGNFVVAWTDYSPTTPDQFSSVIRAQIFGSDGSRVGGEFVASSSVPYSQTDPTISPLADGRFIVAWAGYDAAGPDTDGWAVRAQLFNANGTKVGGEFVVNTTAAADQYRASITTLADGRVVVAWQDNSGTGSDASGTSVRGQILDPRGAGVQLVGTGRGDDFIGTAFNDTMRGHDDNDRLDGAAGDDTAVFSQVHARYLIEVLGSQLRVSGPDGVDTLAGFEHLQFADVTIDLGGPGGGNLNVPRIISGGGGDTTAISVIENQTAVTTVIASDADAGAVVGYAISGGADAARFAIDASTGALRFATAPDFEVPADVDHDNTYEVVVRASDGSRFDNQTILVGISDASEQPPVARFGSEFLVNTTTAWDENSPAIAALYSGQFVAAWQHYGLATDDPLLQGVRLQLFNADGSKLGLELAVDATVKQTQEEPRVAALFDGRIVVTWSERVDSNDSPESGIRAQIFNRDGTKAAAAFTVAEGVGQQFPSTIAQLADGRFAIAWAEDSPGGNVVAQVFNADGSRSGAEFRVNATTAGEVSDPTVLLLTGGRFMVSWTSNIGGDSTVRAQIFRPDGTHFTDEFLLGPTNSGHQPAISCRADGSFVAAWSDFSPTGDDMSGGAVWAQIFNFDGTTSGSRFVANTTTAGNQYSPAISTLADGRFVLAWTDTSATGADTSDDAIRAQVFNADGSRIGTEFVVNTTTSDGQAAPAITTLADGRFVVTWSDSSETGGDTSRDAVRAQIFDPRMAAVQLVGTASADDFIGTAFNDSMFGGIGDDRLDGAAGDDLAIFSSVRNRYMIDVLADGKVVVSGFEGHDGLSNFEHFQFADMTLDATGLEASNPHAPEITSDGGADAVTISIGENNLAVTTVTASDPDQWTDLRYSIGGGADAGRFAINAATGALTFVAAPDFEAPADADRNNSYVVEVRASDGIWSDTQTLTVQVTDVNETPGLIWLIGTPEDDTFTALAGNMRIDALTGNDTVFFNFKLVDATVTHSGNQVIIDSAGSHTVLTGFERYVFADGTVDNVDDARMVDDLFYYSQYHDVWNARVDADEHYQVFGRHEGRDPSAFFSTSLYLALNPDVQAAGVDPLVHFDQIGWREGRTPSIAFDGAAYLVANPDVAAAEVDPLLHFLMFGAQEGRQPFAAATLLAVNGFDYAYYLQHNPDVAATHVDALAHFELFGWREGRNPNALFDTAGYLAAYADVAAAGINPFDHYNQFGWNEGRDPSVQFDTAQYLAHYADVAAAHVNPLVHALHFGLNEGRSPFADGAWG